MISNELRMSQRNSIKLEVELSFNVHATEDERKIMNSLKKNLDLDESLLSRTDFEGYYGNPISKFEVLVRGVAAQKIFETVFKSLESIVMEDLLKHIDNHIDSSKGLYIRISKERLCEDKFRIQESNAFRFKFRPKTGYLKNAQEFYKNAISQCIQKERFKS